MSRNGKGSGGRDPNRMLVTEKEFGKRHDQTFRRRKPRPFQNDRYRMECVDDYDCRWVSFDDYMFKAMVAIREESAQEIIDYLTEFKLWAEWKERNAKK